MKSLVMIALGICTLAAAGQMPRRQPGPEHMRLSYFVGQWKFEGDSEGLKYTEAKLARSLPAVFIWCAARKAAGIWDR